jgi:Flp pilus assembly protein TadG
MRHAISYGQEVKGRRRRGLVIVEFAVVLPLLLLLLFGIVEFGWLFMVRQTLINAAREGCRVAILTTATDADVMGRIREVMEPLGFAEGTIWNVTASNLGDAVQNIRVVVNADEVSLTGGYVLSSSFDLIGECSMRKEGTIKVEDGGA